MKKQMHTRPGRLVTGAGKAFLVATLIFLGAASTTGCATRHVVVHDAAGHRVAVVHKRPPVVRREVRPRRPSSRHVWRGGYWSWRSGSYVWVKGAWTVPPRHGGRWVSGYWKQQGGGWIWMGGYWRY